MDTGWLWERLAVLGAWSGELALGGVQVSVGEVAAGIALILLLAIVVTLLLIFRTRKRSQEELGLQRAYFEQLFENSPQGIVILDEAYNVIDANEAFQRLFQYDLEEIRGKSLNHFIVPATLLADESTLGKVTLGSKVFQKEALRRCKDGASIYVSILSYPIELRKRQIGVYEIYNDITQRKQAENALKESHERFVTVMDSLDAAVYVADMETHEILFVNKYVLRMYGEDLVGKKCWQVLQKGQQGPCQFCTNEKLLSLMGEESSTKTHVWESKNTVTGEWSAYRDRAIQWVDGRIVRLQIATDITETKRAEQKLKKALSALRSSEERLRRVVENMPVMMNAFDSKGSILIWNRECEQVTGYEAGEIVNNPDALRILYPDMEQRDQAREVIEGRSKEVRDKEVKIRCKDGMTKVISWHNISSRFPIRGWASWAIGVDVTERKQLEEERLNTSKLEFIRIFTGGIAHDFNNLLTPVLGNAQLAKAQIDSREKVLEKLEKIEEVSFRAKELINRLQVFAKKRKAPDKKRLDMAELVREKVEAVLSGSKVAPRFRVNGPNHWVECDREQMGQVIVGLLLNACEAMPEGGMVDIDVENVDPGFEQASRLRLKPGAYVKVSVRDHGSGIPKEHLHQIFDLYFTTKPRATDKLTGLGLAIARSIVENHDGCIGVASTEPGRGSVFYVYLPAADWAMDETRSEQKGFDASKEDLITPAAEGPAPVSPSPQSAHAKPTVLLMDDEEFVREICSDMLRHLGYEVMPAGNGEEVIEKYRQSLYGGRPCSVVILDLTVSGGMGAVEVLRELVKVDPNITAVVSSGYMNDPVMLRFQDYGFKGAVSKPYQIMELSQVLKEVRAPGASENI